MRKDFVKLFENEKYGQILIVQDQTEPEIRLTVYPDGYGLIEMTDTYTDFEHSDKVFDLIDEKVAMDRAAKIFELLEVNKLSGEG